MSAAPKFTQLGDTFDHGQAGEQKDGYGQRPRRDDDVSGGAACDDPNRVQAGQQDDIDRRGSLQPQRVGQAAHEIPGKSDGKKPWKAQGG